MFWIERMASGHCLHSFALAVHHSRMLEILSPLMDVRSAAESIDRAVERALANGSPYVPVAVAPTFDTEDSDIPCDIISDRSAIATCEFI